MSKGLKALKKVRYCKYTSAFVNQQAFNTIETELKSWDIVSEYVDVFILGYIYYMRLNGTVIPITEEQYLVLKEAIKDE